MGSMQNNLEQMLVDLGYMCTDKKNPKLTIEDLKKTGFYEHALQIYKALSGIQDVVPLRFGDWDMNFNGLIVELDEQRHFNRYRLITLDSPIYEQLPKFPLKLYREYCIKYEANCIKAGGFGGNWTNSSSEKQFGHSSMPKIMDENGSARWKQRAFYDFLKDVSILVHKVPLVRLSIWDEINTLERPRLLKDILINNDFNGITGLRNLIKTRMHIFN